jgi:hypothetical protein
VSRKSSCCRIKTAQKKKGGEAKGFYSARRTPRGDAATRGHRDTARRTSEGEVAKRITAVSEAAPTWDRALYCWSAEGEYGETSCRGTTDLLAVRVWQRTALLKHTGQNGKLGTLRRMRKPTQGPEEGHTEWHGWKKRLRLKYGR